MKVEPTYYLWHSAMGGWVTTAGTYSSEITDAREFPRHVAMARCILHVRRDDHTIGLIPVLTSDVTEIMGEKK